MDLIITVAVIIIVAGMIGVLTRRVQSGEQMALRPLPALNTLTLQLGQAIETAKQVHITLGQASLINAASPTSIAALNVLDKLAKDGCANGTPPVVTVGEGTLLPVAQERLLHAYLQAERSQEFAPGQAVFLAAETEPFAYAGGVANMIQQDVISSNVLVGRFGPELAIMAEAANRRGMDQVVGSDDPVALALAAAVTDNVLIGEELFAASAYLEGRASHIASVQAQDIMRWLAIAAIVILTLASFFTG